MFGKVGDLSRGELAAGSGIKRSFGTVGRAGEVGQFLFDFAPGAKAWVDHVEGFETGEGFAVGVEPVQLSPGGRFPGDPEPVEVVFDLLVEFRPDAGVVDVFEAQEKAALFFCGQSMGDQGGEGMAEVEIAGWAGSEARGDHEGR